VIDPMSTHVAPAWPGESEVPASSHPQPSNEWFAKPPSPALSAAMWATAKVAAGLQRLNGNRHASDFAILMYHRVAEHSKGLPAPTINVTPKLFRQQLEGLLSRGFECWPLSKLVAAHADSQPVPANVFAITFDDGFANNYWHAWPVLRELNLPATIFLATKYLDSSQPFPFDDWAAAHARRTLPSSWQPLTTEQCREMLRSGVIAFGAHTHSHRKFLGRCGEFQRDMRTCLDVLRERFDIVRPAFAFPYGVSSSEMIAAVKELDVACALTTKHQRVRASNDPYRWGRFYVGESDSSATLAAKLSGWYSTLATPLKKLGWPVERFSRLRATESRHEIPQHQAASSWTVASPVSDASY
jgi:peptidoglycan/xylan/chitin deacetylase (PgdA/CDA1 family)